MAPVYHVWLIVELVQVKLNLFVFNAIMASPLMKVEIVKTVQQDVLHVVLLDAFHVALVLYFTITPHTNQISVD